MYFLWYTHKRASFNPSPTHHLFSSSPSSSWEVTAVVSPLSHVIQAGGRNLCGTATPHPLSSLLAPPNTQPLLSRVWPFCTAGMCSVFVTHTVCLISHIDEIPETKNSLAQLHAYSCCVTVSPQALSATVLERVSRYEWPTHDLQPYKSVLEV